MDFNSRNSEKNIPTFRYDPWDPTSTFRESPTVSTPTNPQPSCWYRPVFSNLSWIIFSRSRLLFCIVPFRTVLSSWILGFLRHTAVPKRLYRVVRYTSNKFYPWYPIYRKNFLTSENVRFVGRLQPGTPARKSSLRSVTE